jgi:hypothetical protein
LSPTVLFFGGNGHAAVRLRAARQALAEMADAGTVAPFEIVEVPYPGFEGRPRAARPAAFLDALEKAVRQTAADPDVLVYATGIGALFAVTLRAAGSLGRGPIVLQGPVLWGLERRLLPRLARAGLAPVLVRLFSSRAFRRHFVRRYFMAAPPAEIREGFFAGYEQCPAAADLFRWCGPSWLRDVERMVSEQPQSLDGIDFWWGARDRVVGPAEQRWTEDALGRRWAERTFADWGHYPMIDDPRGWVRALAEARTRRTPVMIDR